MGPFVLPQSWRAGLWSPGDGEGGGGIPRGLFAVPLGGVGGCDDLMLCGVGACL